ncbi:hypothetical protein Nepgr_024450 [Nepenthes gracilis]|uniref:Uncharacterized protein n=1 Tax=Nepenthes gracilis TaxID=150966 RepID=A0AAD3T5Z4_NEPGR|nr:hypothetical protein Nepgr_024450 [Nepenthes gracilis]
MEAIKARIVPTLGTLILLVIGANGFTTRQMFLGIVASLVLIVASFEAAEAEPLEFQADTERVIVGIDQAIIAVKTGEMAWTASKLNHQGLDLAGQVETVQAVVHTHSCDRVLTLTALGQKQDQVEEGLLKFSLKRDSKDCPEFLRPTLHSTMHGPGGVCEVVYMYGLDADLANSKGGYRSHRQ